MTNLYAKQKSKQKYKDFYALKNVNLTNSKRRIYGLVGENGAGKNNSNPIINGT